MNTVWYAHVGWIAAAGLLGFAEVLILMLVLVWLAARYQRKHPKEDHAT